MCADVLLIENLPVGTKPNTVYAQFYGEKECERIVDVYTHPNYTGKAWVIFSSTVDPGKHESRLLSGEGQRYYAIASSVKEIPFNFAPGARKVERYTEFITRKSKEKKTSTLLISGLTSKELWEDHLDAITPRGLEDNTAYCEKERSGEVKVQFYDKEDAERTWEDIMEKGMHGVYHITARFIDDVHSEEEVKEMRGDCDEDDFTLI